jgi:hypothetical protein
MKLHYDEQVDAAIVDVIDPFVPGSTAFTDELDQDRLVRYDADDRVLSYSFLNVRRHGVRLDDLEHRDELRALFHEAGFRERDWSTPVGAGRRIGGTAGGQNGARPTAPAQAAPAQAAPSEAE